MNRASILLIIALIPLENKSYASNQNTIFNQEQIECSAKAKVLKEEIEQKEEIKKIDILNIYNLLLDSDHKKFFAKLSIFNTLLSPQKNDNAAEYFKNIYYKNTSLNLQEELTKLANLVESHK